MLQCGLGTSYLAREPVVFLKNQPMKYKKTEPKNKTKNIYEVSESFMFCDVLYYSFQGCILACSKIWPIYSGGSTV